MSRYWSTDLGEIKAKGNSRRAAPNISCSGVWLIGAFSWPVVFYFNGALGICWVIGGLFAVLLCSINPNFYHKLFPITPAENVEMLKFAWVGGSIWGGIIGGLLSSILGVVMLNNRWHQPFVTVWQ